MNRRTVLFLGALALGMTPHCGLADIEDALLRRLRAEGFQAIITERTWLGRVRITANGDLGQREIVLNPQTGEVLRDIMIMLDGTSVPTSAVQIKDENSGSGSGSGSNSGSGSSGGSGGSSGSGGGSSGGGSDDGSDDSGDDGGDDKGGSSGSDGGGDDS